MVLWQMGDEIPIVDLLSIGQEVHAGAFLEGC